EVEHNAVEPASAHLSADRSCYFLKSTIFNRPAGRCLGGNGKNSGGACLLGKIKVRPCRSSGSMVRPYCLRTARRCTSAPKPRQWCGHGRERVGLVAHSGNQQTHSDPPRSPIDELYAASSYRCQSERAVLAHRVAGFPSD